MTDRPKVRDSLRSMDGYHSPQVDVAVRLNTNEAPEPPPAGFSEALAAEVASIEWHRYPDRAASELRSALASHHEVDASQVFVANGSNEVLQTLCLTYGGPGRRILTFEPTYALHSHVPFLTGTEVVSVDRNADFVLSVDTAIAAIDEHHPAITFLCSPNNPTGLIEPRETVEAVVRRGTSVGGVVVVDEAYGQFAPWSALSMVDEDLAMVVTRTYSKTWSMAAARLGYLVGPSWLVAELEKVILPYHLDAVKQIAGRLALDFEPEMNQRVATLVEERGRVSARLAELDVELWPSSSNFILFRPTTIDGHAVWNSLLDHSILIRDCSSWPRLDGCLRLTLGTADENDRFLTALTHILDGGRPDDDRS